MNLSSSLHLVASGNGIAENRASDTALDDALDGGLVDGVGGEKGGLFGAERKGSSNFALGVLEGAALDGGGIDARGGDDHGAADTMHSVGDGHVGADEDVEFINRHAVVGAAAGRGHADEGLLTTSGRSGGVAADRLLVYGIGREQGGFPAGEDGRGALGAIVIAEGLAQRSMCNGTISRYNLHATDALDILLDHSVGGDAGLDVELLNDLVGVLHASRGGEAYDRCVDATDRVDGDGVGADGSRMAG